MRMLNLYADDAIFNLEMQLDREDIADLLEMIEEQLNLNPESTWTSELSFNEGDGSWMFALREISEKYYRDPVNLYYEGNKRIERLFQLDE